MKLHWKIIIGMVGGVIFGLLMSQTSFGSDLIKDWIKPFGTIFINLLKLIAMPLILASLVKGISDLKDISKLSTIGTRTLGIYICTTVTAVIIGLVLVNIVQPGTSVTEETRIDLVQEYEAETMQKKEQAQEQSESGPLQPLVDVVPANIFDAATNNRNMLQVIFFAIFFGIGIILIDPKHAKPVKDFFDSFNSIILKLIDLIMESAPYGVFALLATLVVESPSIDLFIALGMYSITLIIGLIIMIFVYGILVKLITNTSPGFFMRGIAAAQLLGFSTSSSAATLPVTMDCAENKLGVDKEISSFVLPIGATVNMDGTSLYQAVAAVFIAQ
ncbi:MAG TPA: dicarboxylate/amino acid:cation symporter, partial [Flavobacteriaceae bacterium]|nr:dicarboxylate/amino acid:cation symporter [Flavobacteriaceae bacterium]